MLVFAKVSVQCHVSKYNLGRVRSRLSLGVPLGEYSPGTNVHCRILEKLAIPDLYVVGGSGPGGMTLDCRVRSSSVDLCRVKRSDLCVWRAPKGILKCNIPS